MVADMVHTPGWACCGMVTEQAHCGHHCVRDRLPRRVVEVRCARPRTITRVGRHESGGGRIVDGHVQRNRIHRTGQTRSTRNAHDDRRARGRSPYTGEQPIDRRRDSRVSNNLAGVANAEIRPAAHNRRGAVPTRTCMGHGLSGSARSGRAPGSLDLIWIYVLNSHSRSVRR